MASPSTVQVGNRERLRRELAVAGIAGPLAGLIGGVLARLAMRGFAMAVDAEVGFSFGGTLGILFAGAVLGVVVGLVHAVVRRAVPGPWFVPGLALGLAATLGLVVPSIGGPGNEGSENGAAARVLFGAVAIGGGLATAWVAARTRRRFEAGGWTEDGWPAVGLLISAGMLLILATVLATSLVGAVVRAL